MDIYCINLKERTDRLEKIKKNVKNINKNNFINLIVIDAIKHKKGENTLWKVYTTKKTYLPNLLCKKLMQTR